MLGRKVFFFGLFLSLCSLPAWSQESPQPELAARLREILQQYETNIAALKSRIAELETQLSDSEARSTSLLADLSASRQELSSLIDRYERLETRLDEYRIQFEASKRLTMSSLDSLTVSMASLKAQNLIQGSGIALVLVAAVVLLFRR
jgi:predicted nuclease with TOPRIM domain